jgi:demethylmenaquinone methyltransferase/2-methoxy-6-polyprenyl-1,4-benzoquinol methylase
LQTPVTPYSDQRPKKEQVKAMFDNISGKYDFLNHFLSLGIDVLWRKKAVKMLASIRPKKILDLATGTGDFALECLVLNPDKVTGLDISPGMLQVGIEKMKRKKADKVEMLLGDCEHLPFEDNSYDAITVGFGVRNFENLEQGLSEMHRVLRPGGKAVVLEPSFPASFPMKQLFSLYFRFILPIVGRLVSSDTSAYTYLPASVEVFPEGEKFLEICDRIGFSKTVWHPLTFGICALYILEK